MSNITTIHGGSVGRFDIRAKLGERLQLIHRIRFDRLRVIDRCAYVTECCVDGVRKGVHFRGLELSGNHERFATTLL